jgi:subtilisin family serine protease
MSERTIVSFTFKSKNGRSIYNMNDLKDINSGNIDEFKPDPDHIKKIAEVMKKEGFTIEVQTEVGLSISGEVEQLEAFFNTKIKKKRNRYIKNYEYYEYTAEQEMSFKYLEDCIEKIFIQKQFFVLSDEASATMPKLDYYHLKVPNDLQRIGNMDVFYRNNIFGSNVKVALIDTGFYYNHPYFIEKKYNYCVIPAMKDFDISKDERGHGSGMSSVLLSVAPKVDYTMIKASDAYVSYPLTAFQKASMMNFDVINCSWGIVGFEPHLYMEIINAIKKGAVVVYSAGNGSTDRVVSILQTIAHPEVISVGGCYPRKDGTFEVSNLSSSYYSDIYTNRYCPDLCGVCGMLPYGQLILFPSQPGSVFDCKNGERDGTKVDDGWFVSSGTSAAAAYVSGLVALAINKKNELERKKIKQHIIHGCKEVVKGKSFMGHEAENSGWNKAVGYGFLDGQKLYDYLEQMKL